MGGDGELDNITLHSLLAVTVIKEEHYYEMSDLNCILTGVGVCANESGCVYFSAWPCKAVSMG